KLSKRKVVGIKGKLELESVSTTAVDGQQFMLDGGYGKEGKSRTAAAATLGAVGFTLVPVLFPLLFMPGKHAELKSGTVLDSWVQGEISVEVDGSAPVKLNLKSDGISASVLYDE